MTLTPIPLPPVEVMTPDPHPTATCRGHDTHGEVAELEDDRPKLRLPLPHAAILNKPVRVRVRVRVEVMMRSPAGVAEQGFQY